MKYILVILGLLFSIGIQAQSSYPGFYKPITKETYDSLINYTWYYGEIYLMDGTSRKGYIHKSSTGKSAIQFKDSVRGKVDNLLAQEVQGWYDIHKGDTALFVMMDSHPKKHGTSLKPMRIIEKGDLTLMVYAWLVKFDSGHSSNFSRWLRPSIYELHWSYFIFENENFHEIFFLKKHLKPLIQDKEEALRYYKKHRRDLDGDCMHKYIVELIKIYNGN